MTHAPKIVDITYTIQIYIFKNVHSTTLCPKGTPKPSNLHSSPNCWHVISNTNIYIQLTHVPQSSARRADRHPPTVIYPPNVGRIYLIQVHVFNWHMVPNPALPRPSARRAHRHPPIVIIPQMLADYIQYKYIYSKMYISRSCARRAHRNPPSGIYSLMLAAHFQYPIYICILECTIL